MKRIILLLLLGLLTGCSFSLEDDPTLTPTPLPPINVEEDTPTFTPTATETPTVTPTATATDTPLPADTPTSEPSATSTETPLPTDTPLPTSTPMSRVDFKNDEWQQIDVPTQISEGLSTNWLAFINYNDRTTRSGTPGAASQIQTLYMYRPDTNQRIKIFEMPASVGDRVFVSPAGTHLTYFVEPGGDAEGGLYMLDLTIGLSYRLFDIPNINPHGIPGHVPAWSGDGRKLAVALTTEYATDIFIMNADGTGFRNVTQHGSYDLWPALSPDGLWLAFVSDRVSCPTRTPGEPNTCDSPDASPPTEGNLFIQNLNTGELRQVTDIKLNGPPRWMTDSKLVFSTGGGNALATQSDIWMVDIEAGSAVQITDPGTLNISEAWTDDGNQVVYQRAATSSLIILADNVGREIATSTEFIFPRYGMAADWSPDNQYLAIGGHNGQCPYGIIVFDPLLQVITEPGSNLLACDPKYAPEGRFMAYVGIRPGTTTDGRVDIYLANLNGLGARSITADLQGQMLLLDWVGPTPPQPEE